MKILAVADIHCSFNYSCLLAYKALKENVDLILIAGDIECLDPVEEFVNTGIKVYAVTGNTDDPYIYRFLRDKNIIIDGLVIVYNNILIVGVGGLNTKMDLEKVTNELKQRNLDGYRLRIVLSHYPAYGFNDVVFKGIHTGLHELRHLIDLVRPQLYVHGHVHEARGVSTHDGTYIINPGPLMHGYYALINIVDEGIGVKLERIE